MNDEYDSSIATPRDFASERFAQENKAIFDEYIELRIRGVNSAVAYRMILGDEYADNHAQSRIYALEMNPYFRKEFPLRLGLTPIADLWNPKVAVHELLSVVRDRFAKESARISAMKELNVITNITIVDDSGKSKPGRSLADFYATEGKKSTVEVEEGDLPVITHQAIH